MVTRSLKKGELLTVVKDVTSDSSIDISKIKIIEVASDAPEIHNIVYLTVKEGEARVVGKSDNLGNHRIFYLKRKVLCEIYQPRLDIW